MSGALWRCAPRRPSGADYAGVDLLAGRDGTVYVLEVNGIPGWKGLTGGNRLDVAGRLVDFVAPGPGDHAGRGGRRRAAGVPAGGERAQSRGMCRPSGTFTTPATRISWRARWPSAPRSPAPAQHPLGTTIRTAVEATAALDPVEHQSRHRAPAGAPGPGCPALRAARCASGCRGAGGDHGGRCGRGVRRHPAGPSGGLGEPPAEDVAEAADGHPAGSHGPGGRSGCRRPRVHHRFRA